MAVYLFANNAHTTLAGPIASGATSLSLAAGTGALFPNPAAGQQFELTLRSQTSNSTFEIVYCTSRAGDVCTIVRGQEGTPPTAFVAGDFADNFLTAGTTAAFTQATQLQQQAGNYAVDTGVVNAYVITRTPAPSSLGLTTGEPIRFKVTNTNTGASTLADSGLAATVIVNRNGSSLRNGQLKAGTVVTVIYDGTSYELQNSVVGFPAGPAGAGTGITVNTNLSSAAWGCYFNVGSGAIITLPGASVVTDMSVGFFANSSATINSSGGTFVGGSLSTASVSLAASDFFCIQSDGVNWRIFSASPNVFGYLSQASHGSQYFAASGNFTVPAFVTRVYAELWGGGGGSVGATGASGAGGGYAAGWVTVAPGQVLTVVVGAGGVGSVTAGAATAGGTSGFGSFSATGGSAGNAGAGSGGSGFGGTINITGGCGFDLDASTTSQATGGAAPRGGQGGGAGAFGATAPGGGAGASVVGGFQNGAAGGVYITW